jgi:hypothetical protein
MLLRSFAVASSLLSLTILASVNVADAADISAKPPKQVDSVPFFTVNDNRLTYAYMFTATDPGVSQTAKQVFAFTHFDVWAYGTNLLNISLLKSDSRDPTVGCVPALGPCAGATEIYGFIRSTIGLNELFNTRALSVGPLRNVSFVFGGDANTVNNMLAPAKRDGVIGLQFAVDLPYKGYFNIAPLFYKEINHNTFLTPAFNKGIGIPTGDVEFRGTWAIETNYYMDLGFLPDYVPFAFSGRAAWYGPKGQGTDIAIPGNVDTKTEFNSEQRLTLDVSKIVWGPIRSHFLDVWVAYRYWQNKFGLDHINKVNCNGTISAASAGSCTEQSWYTGVTVKF